ncbi:MAG: hypothetical protein ACT4P7_02165 [Gemmatimonadaceae bacterium]
MPGKEPSHRPPVADPSATDAPEWERKRAAGRTRFIIRKGVLGWGIPAAFLTIFYKVIQEQGLVWTPRLTENLRAAIVIAIIVFPFGGWLFGRWLWDTGETRYRARMHGESRDRNP